MRTEQLQRKAELKRKVTNQEYKVELLREEMFAIQKKLAKERELLANYKHILNRI